MTLFQNLKVFILYSSWLAVSNWKSSIYFQLTGAVSISGNQKLPLTLKQLLLRGCVLRNTDWCVGVAVYVGDQTKLMLNSMYVGMGGNGNFNYNFVIQGTSLQKKLFGKANEPYTGLDFCIYAHNCPHSDWNQYCVD